MMTPQAQFGVLAIKSLAVVLTSLCLYFGIQNNRSHSCSGCMPDEMAKLIQLLHISVLL